MLRFLLTTQLHIAVPAMSGHMTLEDTYHDKRVKTAFDILVSGAE